jgi:hypothetical protein
MEASMRSNQIIGKVIAIFLVLSFLLASYPQPAQAACAFKYKVQAGDSLYGLAALFEVSFEDLVEANDLKTPYIIYVGQVLCVPPGGVKPEETTTTDTTTTTTTTTKKVPTVAGIHQGTIAWISVTNFPKERIYYVNVYPGAKYYWSFPRYKVGMVWTDKEGQFGYWFQMPVQVEDEELITICVKDVLTDDVLACSRATNTDLRMDRRYMLK